MTRSATSREEQAWERDSELVARLSGGRIRAPQMQADNDADVQQAQQSDDQSPRQPKPRPVTRQPYRRL